MIPELSIFAIITKHGMKSKVQRILGISLIVLTWIFWGMIFIIPFLKLGVRLSAILIAALLIGTNAFWIGLFLVGKEYAKKFQVKAKLKKWFRHERSS
jgi:predicted membrane protein